MAAGDRCFDLSPSDFAFAWEACPRCFYMKVVEGAQALGMRAFLVDRENRYPEVEGRLRDLYALPAALGLPRPGSEVL